MDVNDIIKHTMLSEVDGVAVSNGFYYIIKDNTLATTLDALAAQIHADWWDRIKDKMSFLTATVCSTWENLMGTDASFAVFQTIVGTHVGGNMPADNIILVTRKTITSSSRVSTGSLQMSGVANALVKDGHLIDYEIGLGMESWLITDQTYGPTIIRNVQPYKIGEDRFFDEVTVAQTNPHVRKRSGRRSFLCKSLA